jgi:hypothetical protein
LTSPLSIGCGSERGSARVAALLLVLLPMVSVSASAQTTPPPAPKAEKTPSFRISGLVYGDYYFVASNHRDELEGENGFWIRRLYLTYDHALSKSLSLRVRLEADSKGDFETTGVNTPYLKDAWLKWAFGAHALTFGLAPTANIDFVDAFQGYRSVEKDPFDLYRWDSSRDLGLLLQGGLGKEKRTRYSLQFGNGSGTGSETDASKAVRGEILHRFAGGLVRHEARLRHRPAGDALLQLVTSRRERAARLPEQKLGVAGHDVVHKLADQLVAQPLVEPPRPVIEVRHADEDVLVVAEDALLGEGDERGTDTCPPELRSGADGLDIAHEGTLQVQDQQAREPIPPVGDVPFPRVVEHHPQAGLVLPPERDPGLRPGHHPRARLRLGPRLEQANHEVVHVNRPRGP